MIHVRHFSTTVLLSVIPRQAGPLLYELSSIFPAATSSGAELQSLSSGGDDPLTQAADLSPVQPLWIQWVQWEESTDVQQSHGFIWSIQTRISGGCLLFPSLEVPLFGQNSWTCLSLSLPLSLCLSRPVQDTLGKPPPHHTSHPATPISSLSFPLSFHFTSSSPSSSNRFYLTPSAACRSQLHVCHSSFFERPPLLSRGFKIAAAIYVLQIAL